MRILIVTPYYYPATAFGGPVWSIRNMARGLAEHHAQPFIVTTNADKPTKRRPGPYEVDHLPVSCRRQFGSGSYAFSPGLGWEVFRRVHDVDVVYTSGMWTWPVLAGCTTARHAGKPYVMSPRGTLDPWALRHRGSRKALYLSAIENRNLRGAAAVHCLTRREADQVLELVPEARCRVVPNSVSIDTAPVAAETRDEFFASFPELRNRRIVLFLSRIHKKKGLDILIPAFADVAKRVDDAHLVVAGPDEDGYRADVERLVEHHRMGSRVTFTGLVNGERKRAVLESAHVFVLPSYGEGLPVSVLEAMAFGCPVVITRGCNLDEEVEASGAGLVTTTDRRAVASALERLLRAPDSLKEMGEAGRRLVEQRYSFHAVTSQMASMFEEARATTR